jgi:hypothetical protein
MAEHELEHRWNITKRDCHLHYSKILREFYEDLLIKYVLIENSLRRSKNKADFHCLSSGNVQEILHFITEKCFSLSFCDSIWCEKFNMVFYIQLNLTSSIEMEMEMNSFYLC